MKESKRQLEQIKKTYTPTLSRSVWDMNFTHTKLLIQSIQDQPNIHSVNIVIYQEGIKVHSIQTGHKNGDHEEQYIFRFKLGIENTNPSEYLGDVTIIMDSHYLTERLKNKMMIILPSRFVEVFILTAIIIMLVRKLITKHLVTMEEFAKNINFKNPKYVLRLNRKNHLTGKYDELDQVVQAINDMQVKLHQHINEQILKEKEIQKINSNLERKIFELEELNEVSKTLSSSQKQQDIANVVLFTAVGYLGTDNGLFYIPKEKYSKEYKLLTYLGYDDDELETFFKLSEEEFDILKTKKTFFKEENVLPAIFSSSKAKICFPLFNNEEPVGLCVFGENIVRGKYNEENIKLAEQVIQQANAPIGKSQYYLKIIEFNQEIQRQGEELKVLNQNLEEMVEERTIELKKTHKELLKVAHQAGMAEISTGVLHNIGNVLTSIVVSSQNVMNIIRKAPLNLYEKASKDLNTRYIPNLGKEEIDNIRFLKLLNLLVKLEEAFKNSFTNVINELESIIKSSDIIRGVVETQ